MKILTKLLPAFLAFALFAGAASFASPEPEAAGAADAVINSWTDPARWMPNYVVTGSSNQNDNNGGHDIWYWFNFTRTSGMSSFYWSAANKRGTLELGWKDTGHLDCNDAKNVLKRGWPSDVKVSVDPVEDDTDAVIWISNLPNLRRDQIANPAKEYFIAYDCHNEAGFTSAPHNDDFRHLIDERPVLEAQLGTWKNPWNSPYQTFSDRTQTLIPAEQGWKGFPPPGNDTWWVQTNVNLPWTKNWDMETNSDWRGVLATKAHICNDGKHGSCYFFINPTHSQWNSQIRQNLKVPSTSSRGQIFAGSNTDYTVSLQARCPTWGPNKYHKGNNFCKVRVGLRPLNETSITWSEEMQISNDHSWTLLQTPTDMDWPAHRNDDDIEIIIDSRGYYMDIDGVWLSSGI